MTYCVGMLLEGGLVMLSDSRTNAGVDQINSFGKMTVFERPGDRVMVLLSAGNLAITQSVVAMLRRRLDAEDGTANLMGVPTMYEAALCLGEVLRQVHAREARAFKDHGVEFNASFILGGQILGEPPRLFQVYAAGNFVEAGSDTNYFQIGESKYGKPIIDRVIDHQSSLSEAAKCALISMDSTIRSNLSVGAPLDLAVIERDRLQLAQRKRIDGDDEYFQMIRGRWGLAMKQAFADLPDPPFIGGPAE